MSNREIVLLIVGSHCVGKSTLACARPPGVTIIREIDPDEMDLIPQLIRDVIRSGRHPIVALVYCDNPRTPLRRAVERAKSQPEKIYPIAEMAKAFVLIPKKFFEYSTQYPEAEFFGLDNSGSRENTKITLSSSLSSAALTVANNCLECMRNQPNPN